MNETLNLHKAINSLYGNTLNANELFNVCNCLVGVFETFIEIDREHKKQSQINNRDKNSD